MNKRNKIQILSISACILFLGIMCLALPKAIKSGKEDIRFDYQLTDMEKRDLEHKWTEKLIVSALEHLPIIQGCEVNINWSESEIIGADIKVTMSAGNIGNDTMKTNIAENISKMLDISTENIAISFVNEVLP